MNRRRFRTLGAGASGTRQVQKATGIDKAHAVVGGFHLAPADALHGHPGGLRRLDSRRGPGAARQNLTRRPGGA